ncbi:hypothetical protein TIFTF001_020082 [Ficus carica]|uniref:Transmembrane protein n=1 Tax=Ficus carica TaxID=3494 RepID=A0AA88AR89_FICCA|nr:hypothetical protein TIFTF001_020082 [Ficus carica]
MAKTNVNTIFFNLYLLLSLVLIIVSMADANLFETSTQISTAPGSSLVSGFVSTAPQSEDPHSSTKH